MNSYKRYTTQKMKFSIKDFFSKIEGLIYKSLLNACDGKKTTKEPWIELRHVQADSTKYLTFPSQSRTKRKKWS